MRLVITGGGTGGHLFPGLAVAQAMQRRYPATEILFIGTERSMDQQVLEGADMQREILQCSGLKGVSIAARVKSVALFSGAVLHALKILRQCKAELVLGVGGYVTGPVLVAAKMLGIRTCIHEQNSVPGLANRLAGKIVDRIFTSIPCEDCFPADKVLQTGNPVRREIVEAAPAGEKDGVTLLVLGGSQGAHRINTLMMEAAREFGNLKQELRIIHQAGRRDAKMVQTAYDACMIASEVHAFITNMAQKYSQADFVVSRAGATTLAELAVRGLPALLIPYPYAADDHQQKNAEYFARQGGGLVFSEKELTGMKLAAIIKEYAASPQQLEPMAENMRRTGLPDAAEVIVEQCMELVYGNKVLNNRV
ncbi:MAG: undecaprenyldiphospho-muramoylpentapeptide beta-N-acetylglucosaminyltransferase [Desulfobulbus propionicus]|nr:MAG: undecaprenyldiphospho-muramoylpentapeptide beta-N-acetylglucosaminyltransferase [Desulfobulbus propionicus]